MKEKTTMAPTRTRQERRAAVLDDPYFEKVRTPRRRAVLSVLLLSILLVEAIAFGLLAAGIIHTMVFSIILGGLILGLVLTLGALKASTRGIEELSPKVLDERQAWIRGSVYARSYALLAGLFTFVVVILLLIQLGTWEVPGVIPLVVAIIAVQLMVIIPTLVTARHTTL